MASPMAHTPITYVGVETVCVSSSGSNRRGDVSLHGLIICVWVSRKRTGKSNRCKFKRQNAKGLRVRIPPSVILNITGLLS